MSTSNVTSHRLTWLLATMLGLLICVVVWIHGAMVDARSAAHDANENLIRCRQLVTSIVAVRHKPAIAGSQEMHLTELTQQIEQASNISSLPLENIVRIWPEPARRLSDTVYLEKPTQILLRQVTLRQLTTFLHHLASGPASLHVGAIRLSAPRGQDVGSEWTVDISLTYLIYSPINSASLPPMRAPNSYNRSLH